jgi:hypothetical protein
VRRNRPSVVSVSTIVSPSWAFKRARFLGQNHEHRIADLSEASVQAPSKQCSHIRYNVKARASRTTTVECGPSRRSIAFIMRRNASGSAPNCFGISKNHPVPLESPSAAGWRSARR